MDEFALIDALKARFGAATSSDRMPVGIGDDSSVNIVPSGHELVSSIDTLVAGTHFPVDAPGRLVGYRAMMVSLSDLAAMGADPLFVLLALILPDDQSEWALEFASGAAEAALATGTHIAGGNLTRGPLSASVSVHGTLPAGSAVKRSSAGAGDVVYVSGHLGGAAAALRLGLKEGGNLTALNERYWRPRARLDLATVLRGAATAAIDISDGLVQDLGHVLRASGLACDLHAGAVPVFRGATLDDALYGGDDYELCFTLPPHLSAAAGSVSGRADGLHLPGWPAPVFPIGTLRPGAGITIDGRPPSRSGYRHFV